ncbi:ABC transporter [Microbacterium sp. JZ31]|uniref:ABC transporter n=1 Tax=Microbacterium sp. JZ31 TaxID=1906274 RepID=UPI001932479C|nr:ABC transporter [Microbacterium sp. JZ31]
MTDRRPLTFLTGALALVVLAGCASGAPASPAETPTESSAGHGEIAGAAEVAEPPLQLVSIDDKGAVGSLDLLDGSASRLGTVGEPESVATDGRYVFVAVDGGVGVIDSGVWTWDHVDHFHYYRAEPAVVGEVRGEGPVSVSTGPLSTAGGTGLYFAGSGEAVLLDNAELSRGRIVETLRVETGLADGVVAPLGDGALVSDADGGLSFHGADGTAAQGVVACASPSGAIATRAGLVVGCADGAVLATLEGGDPAFERIPYPEGATAERASAFEARKGRPTVAALAGDQGFWLLDARERAWQLVRTAVPLVSVVAADDADGNVVALDEDGRVRVYAAATGEERAVTEPLVDAADGPGVGLSVDAQRAYLNDPATGVVHEIAYADEARIARTLETPTRPDFFAEVGR